jgi:AraC family cel operon transcriptional repressor
MIPAFQTLKLSDFVDGDQVLHFSRSILPKSRPKAPHTHDFFELFWLQHGQARHVVSDRIQNLTESDLVFIRPHDVHAIQGRGEETHLVNVILAPSVVSALVERHPDLDGRFFWSTDDTPSIAPHDSKTLADLSRAALKLELGPRTALATEAFLLPLLNDLAPSAPQTQIGAPDWLLRACDTAQSPRVFQEGAAGFVAAAGRAHAHVSRTARKFLGQSPSEYVNTIRMEHAARRLAGTGDSLPEIAAECGIPNLSHFHRLFRIHHDITPRAYRKIYQRELVRPDAC